MTLSIIIPTLNEEACLAATLARTKQPGVLEVIVVDGGSQDRTPAIAAQGADMVLSAAPGRASQMNAGANAARGDILLFLHADTLLPLRFPEAIARALADTGAIGGRFDVHLNARGWTYRLIAFGINLRSRLTRIATGDQAIFIDREVFLRLGGYPAIPLLEDVALTRKMKAAGRVACLREKVITSARRWQKEGIGRTVLRMWVLRFLYFIGVSPFVLKRAYPETR